MEQIKTIKELAAELNTTPKALRKWLRDHNINKPGKRWEWIEGHEDLEKIKQLRNESKRGRKKAVKVEVEEVKDPYIAEKVGAWNIWKDPKNGTVQAGYQGPKSTDKTPWYADTTNIRKSLPKAVQEAIIKHLQ